MRIFDFPSVVFLLAAGILALSGCSDTPGPSEPPGGMSGPDGVSSRLTLTSPAFKPGGWMPDTYTCAGPDFSPPLRLKSVPGSTRSLVLVLEDLDAPGGRFHHWRVWNLPPGTHRIPPGLPTRRRLTDFGRARQGRNDFGHVGYGGPCPPPGETHRYRFRVYALAGVLELSEDPRKRDLTEAVEEAELARGNLRVRYRRGERR